ncbi:hypothetical protein CSUI_007629, partial [Cystoisospora suis]
LGARRLLHIFLLSSLLLFSSPQESDRKFRGSDPEVSKEARDLFERSPPSPSPLKPPFPTSCRGVTRRM